MSWRVVVVRGRCKLEYKLGYLVACGGVYRGFFDGSFVERVNKKQSQRFVLRRKSQSGFTAVAALRKT